MHRVCKSLAAIALAAGLMALPAVGVEAAEPGSDPDPGAAPPAEATAASRSDGARGGPRGGGHGDLPGVGTLTWGPCDNPTLIAFGAECSSLSVPLDYSKPHGTKIELAVSRVVHGVPEEDYQGIMLVNPGGPGGSGLVYSVLGSFVPDGVGASYTWVGFDPRGVGDSEPSLSCIPDYFAGPRPDYVVTNSPAAEEAWLDRSAAYSAACEAAGGDLLDHLKTTDTVMDMNAIRQAMGEQDINFYGFSYGTYLAQVFATKYPKKVRRMVLDSNVNPRQVWYDANIDQDYAFEVVFGLFFDWVARHNDTYGLGSTAAEVEAAFYEAQDTLRASPAGSLGPGELTDGFLVAGYLQELWPEVASAFAALVNEGDPAPATVLYEDFNDVSDDNGYAMYVATECTDARWPRHYWWWKRDAIRVSADAPFLTWANTWFNAPCLTWPARPARPVYVRDRGVPPILLVSETLDAATPYSGSLEVRRRFRSSVLIATEGGTTHANSLFGGNACVDDRIADYLRDGTLPDRVGGRQADVVCPALPEPEPAATVGPLALTTAAASADASTLVELRLAMLRGF